MNTKSGTIRRIGKKAKSIFEPSRGGIGIRLNTASEIFIDIK